MELLFKKNFFPLNWRRHTSPNVEPENTFSNNGSVISEATDQISLLHRTPIGTHTARREVWSSGSGWGFCSYVVTAGVKEITSLCPNPHHPERVGKAAGPCFPFLHSCTEPTTGAFHGVTGL